MEYLMPQRDLCSTGMSRTTLDLCSVSTLSLLTLDPFLVELCRVDSAERFKAKLPGLVEKLKDPAHFKEFYRYIFMFAKDSEQKCMPVDVRIVSRGFVTQRGPSMHRFDVI